MSEQTTLPTEDLRALFDIATGSLDFTSGCLDTDEVNLLRAVAVRIGVDPLEATPKEFVSQYPHPFNPFDDEDPTAGCRASYWRCKAGPDDPIHDVPPPEGEAR